MKFSFETPKKDGDKIVETEFNLFGKDMSFRLERGDPKASFQVDDNDRLIFSATPGGVQEISSFVKSLKINEKYIKPAAERLEKYNKKLEQDLAEKKKRNAEQTAKKYPAQEGKEEADLINDISNILKTL